MGRVIKETKCLYEDNIGEIHKLNTDNAKILEVIERLDDLISDSVDNWSLHVTLVDAWDKIMERFSSDG